MSSYDPKLRTEYDSGHRVTDADREQLPDTQNADPGAIKGTPVAVQRVGASHFRLPMKIVREDGSWVQLETSVTGTVKLGAGVRGINMSRILRTFYEYKEEPVRLASLRAILERIREEVQTEEADLQLSFSYPIERDSLRSGMRGYQYYDVLYEGMLGPGGFRPKLQLDFVYSSACPGSSDLAEHARAERQTYAIPHSQRSRARVSVELDPEADFSIEALHRLCLEALQTEVQVMVRREDEQAFAELNGAYTKFVEDAARLLFAALDPVAPILDFRVVCVHLESLHAHDAVAVLVKGVPGGFRPDFENFRQLIC